jgi:hypothetical protein
MSSKAKKSKWTNHLSRDGASALHKETLAALKEAFPHFTIRQEYSVELFDDSGKKSILYLDFFISEMMVAIECQGKQHFEETPFFHATSGSFKQQQANDSLKKRWCEINDVSLVEVTYREKPSVEMIKRKINEVL